MLKFNNNHIFTGYLKQLLSSFNLPKCKVYTKEQQQYFDSYTKRLKELEDLEEINSVVAIIDQLNLEIKDIQSELNKIKEESSVRQLTDEDQAIQSRLQYCYEANTKELLRYQNIVTKFEHTKEYLSNRELNILKTTYHSSYEIYPGSIAEDLPIKLNYGANMRYIPYIKDGYIQVYADNSWHKCHNTFKTPNHSKSHKNKSKLVEPIRYSYGQKILNYTKNLQIQNTIYDSYTHEYLGDYLRFHRDFANINLMPLYNCFSNRACPYLDLEFAVSNTYTAKFKTDQSFENTLYKYYMVPVKFFKNYTIAIDCMSGIEMCCCIYDKYYNQDSKFNDIPRLTYQYFGDLQFKTPKLYTGLQNINDLLVDISSDLCQHEDDLKLILKIPAENKSSIVILEGNYTAYNDSVVYSTTDKASFKNNNKTVINYEDLDVLENLTDKLITPLQLLRTNTGESYPFADRLVEYLVGNAITLNETIKDNITRVKSVVAPNCNSKVYSMPASDGIWEPILQCLIYDYINDNYHLNDINHDILGFVDKDVEKWYSNRILKRDKFGAIMLDEKNKPVIALTETIANIDIYKD